MIKTFQRFQSALSLSGARVDPYQISHPMPRDRIANLQTLAASSAYYDQPDSETLQRRHDMMRAKIAIFTQGQSGLSRVSRRNIDPVAKQYGEALGAYLYGNPKAAAAKADALIKAQPKNPYFNELRGDALMKANRPKEAAEAYARAVKLDPARSGILQVALGQAFLAMGDEASVEKAVGVLKQGLAKDKEIRRRLSISGSGLWPARQCRRGRPRDRRPEFLQWPVFRCPGLRHPRAAEAQARLAGMGQGPGHHQVQTPAQKARLGA